jgi:hypothetical protein
MKTQLNIFIIPSALIVMFFANAFTPVYVLGCYTRGLVAFIIASVSGIAAIITGIVSIRKRLIKDPLGKQWMYLSFLLSVPVAALLYLA